MGENLKKRTSFLLCLFWADAKNRYIVRIIEEKKLQNVHKAQLWDKRARNLKRIFEAFFPDPF